jgi:hypothetical protein
MPKPKTTQSLKYFTLILPIKTEAIPSANMGDGKDFGLTRTSTLGFVPLSTDFNVGIGFGKKFDIQAKHTFLVANLSQINPTISGRNSVRRL